MMHPTSKKWRYGDGTTNRCVGLLAAVELATDKAAKNGLEQPGQLRALANSNLQAAGVISRNMNDALALCPPLTLSESHVDDLHRRFRAALDATRARFRTVL